MQDGELLLVDAAGFYKYMTVDITRTYPINGTLQPSAERDIYNLVLQAQEEAMKVAKAGKRLADMHAEDGRRHQAGTAQARADHRCQRRSVSGPGTRTASTHWIGMDVHDVGDDRARSCRA